MNRKVFHLFFVLTFLLLASACVPALEDEAPQAVSTPVGAAEVPSAAYEGVLWTLQSLLGADGRLTDVIAGSRITAEFNDGTISGKAGCNSYSGNYEIADGVLSIGPLASTMMACMPEEIMDQEATYLTFLAEARGYDLIDGSLMLMDESGQTTLVYVPDVPLSLEDTLWLAMGYNNGKEAFVSILLETNITAKFLADGSLVGHAGCNNYNASYETDGESITFGPGVTTMKACAEEVMEQEQAYLAALASSTSYRIEDDILTLLADDGRQMVTFEGILPGSAEYAPASDGVLGILWNLEYQTEWTASGTAPLEFGEYREQAAPGSASEIIVHATTDAIVTLFEETPTAFIILWTQPGGSGTFYELAAVELREGQWHHVTSTLLGDRIEIKNLSMEDGFIQLELVAQGPDDAMCCPSQHERRSYSWDGETLSLADTEVLGTMSAETIVGQTWFWLEGTPLDGEQVLVDDPSKYTLLLNEDGSASVAADCNLGTGTYEISGDAIQISILTMTLAMCPEGSLSESFVALLNAATAYSRVDGQLLLETSEPQATLTFGLRP